MLRVWPLGSLAQIIVRPLFGTWEMPWIILVKEINYAQFCGTLSHVWGAR